MYKEIQKHPNVREIYKNQLLKEGIITETEVKEIDDKIWAIMEQAYDKSKNQKIDYNEWLDKPWEDIKDWQGEKG